MCPKQRHHFANKGLSSQSYGFSSSHRQMWELDHKEGWAPKNWCFWIVLLEKALESPLDCKEIQPVNPKGNQSWIFIGRTDAKAEAPVIWLLDAEPTHWKRLMLEKTEGRRRREWQRTKLLESITNSKDMSLSKLQEIVKDRGTYSPWGHKKSDTTYWLNNNRAKIQIEPV